MTVVAKLEERSFDPAAELAELMHTCKGAGAVVTFVGLARAKSRAGDKVDVLVLDHHHQLTAKSLQSIAAAAAERFAISHTRVVHRCGRMRCGDPIVFVGVASPHRRAAFEAADYLMDRLKTEAVFWKREEGESGTNWIEPTETDYADRRRWE